MKNYILNVGVFTLVTIIIGASFGSCRKKEDTIAKITVRDTANVLVPGATVILFGESTTDPVQPVVRRDTAVTNSSGVAIFNYNDEYQLGQAGFAVLNISAEKGTLYGEGTIKIEEEKENIESVFIQP